MADSGSLSGRIALVTGGSGGIGAALCRALAGEGAGVAVGYGSNRAAAESLVTELSWAPGGIAAFGGDLSDPEGPARLVADVARGLGPIDLLVANHGVARMAAYDDVDAAAFDHARAGSMSSISSSNITSPSSVR